MDRLRRELLEPLCGGSPAQFVHRDWWDAERAEVRVVHSQGIVLVEGTYTLHGRLRDLYDERIFLECPQELALERARARDVPQSEDPHTASLVWRQIHGPAEAACVREQSPRARLTWRLTAHSRWVWIASSVWTRALLETRYDDLGRVNRATTRLLT